MNLLLLGYLFISQAHETLLLEHLSFRRKGNLRYLLRCSRLSSTYKSEMMPCEALLFNDLRSSSRWMRQPANGLDKLFSVLIPTIRDYR